MVNNSIIDKMDEKTVRYEKDAVVVVTFSVSDFSTESRAPKKDEKKEASSMPKPLSSIPSILSPQTPCEYSNKKLRHQSTEPANMVTSNIILACNSIMMNMKRWIRTSVTMAQFLPMQRHIINRNIIIDEIT